MAHSSDRNRWCARVISDWDGRGYGRECLSVVEGEQLIVSPYIFVHTHIYIYIYKSIFRVQSKLCAWIRRYTALRNSRVVETHCLLSLRDMIETREHRKALDWICA